MANIEQARREVHRCVRQALEVVDRGTPLRVADAEESLWSALLALGRALMTLYFVRQAAQRRPDRYEHGGREYMVTATESTAAGTLFGKVKYAAPVARVIGDSRAARDRPLQRELGMPGGFTPAVVTTV